MAEFRNIHTRIWKDEWFTELEPDAKMLFIYLFSNERASVCGLYELPLKFIVFETGLDKDRVLAILDTFEKAGKAYYRDGYVWVVNLKKYNDSGNSPKVMARIAKDLESIPDCELKRLWYKHENIPYPKQKIPYLENSLRQRREETETQTDTLLDNNYSSGVPDKQFYVLSPDLQAETIFTDVTGWTSMPQNGDKENVIHAVNALLVRHKNRSELIPYLQPFWETFSKRYPMSTKTFWLTEWAIANRIPDERGKAGTNGNGRRSGRLAPEI